jgi:signal transduction histidine kinase
VARSWRGWPVLVRDGLGAVGLFVVGLLPLGVGGLQLGELHGDVGWPIALVLTAAQTLPLAFRRRSSGTGLVIVGSAFFIAQVIGANTGLAGLGLLVALYLCGAHLRRRAVVAVVALLVYGALVAVLVVERSPERPIDWVTFAGVLALPWALGELVRRRRREQEIREERATLDAVSGVRALLARDLHDIVTHHVTAIVVQAESARYLPATAEGDAERASTFTVIGSTGRQALTELRSLLDALDPAAAADAPLGVADDIPHMVERLRATGYPVVLDAPGDGAPAPDAIAAVVNAVAREALTNAMKHARGREVVIRVTTTADGTELTVSNAVATDTEPIAAPIAEPAERRPVGRGLAGMADRVSEAGGVFDSGVRDRRFEVRARWPR